MILGRQGLQGNGEVMTDLPSATDAPTSGHLVISNPAKTHVWWCVKLAEPRVEASNFMQSPLGGDKYKRNETKCCIIPSIDGAIAFSGIA